MWFRATKAAPGQLDDSHGDVGDLIDFFIRFWFVLGQVHKNDVFLSFFHFWFQLSSGLAHANGLRFGD